MILLTCRDCWYSIVRSFICMASKWWSHWKHRKYHPKYFTMQHYRQGCNLAADPPSLKYKADRWTAKIKLQFGGHLKVWMVMSCLLYLNWLVYGVCNLDNIIEYIYISHSHGTTIYSKEHFFCCWACGYNHCKLLHMHMVFGLPAALY